ncbi:MAG: hypothetical protein FWD53_12035, partial [Phycisphaerales bacterium]|nr:hypothetical protein [Phycisphaerales bacterium]
DDELITSLLAQLTPLTAVKYLSQDAAVSGTPEVTVAITLTEPPPLPAIGPTVEPPAPAKENTITRTLKIFKDGTSWKATWDGPGIQWTFEPTPELIQLVTKTTYGVEGEGETR